MSAIVSGNVIGLLGTSLYTLGVAGRIGQAENGTGKEAVYVNISNGNLIMQRQDEFLAGRGLNITALRTYNSSGVASDGDNNDNWNVGFYRELQLTGTVNTGGSIVVRVAADGSHRSYNYDAITGRYVSQSRLGGIPGDTVVYSATTGQWTWTNGASGNTETWQWNVSLNRRLLLSERDPSGNSNTYSYNSAGLLISIVSNNASETTKT